MPWKVEIDTAARVVVASAHGVMASGEFASISERIRVMSAFDRDFDLVVDIRELDGENVTTQEGVDMTRQSRLFSSKSRHALIVMSAEGIGMGRMFNLQLSEERIRIFDDPAAAHEWLAEPT